MLGQKIHGPIIVDMFKTTYPKWVSFTEISSKKNRNFTNDIVSLELHLKKNNYFKSPIGTISQGKSNNSIQETNFKEGHLNQE